MTKKPTVRRLERRVVNAAMIWHKWLVIDGTGADYHKYCNAFDRLKRACAALLKARKK